MDSDSDPAARTQLEMLKLWTKQRESQQHTVDVWFRYYLLALGAPIAALVSLFQAGRIHFDLPQRASQWNASYLDILALIFLILGLLFYGMHVQQRKNVVRYVNNIHVFQQLVVESAVPSGLSAEIYHPRPEPYGADYYVAWMYAFINCIWAFAFVLLLPVSVPLSSPIWWGLATLLSGLFLAGQIWWRERKLSSESILPTSK